MSTAILHSSPPTHELNPDFYHFDKPQSPRYQAITATPTPRDENLRTPRYNGSSGDRQTQKHHVQSKYLVPRFGVPKHRTVVNESQQISYLDGGVVEGGVLEGSVNVKGGVNNASSPRVSRYNSNREAAPADRKNISEMPKAVQVSSPESPLGRCIWQAMWEGRPG